jgi:small-conductance mechanosensitive channel
MRRTLVWLSAGLVLVFLVVGQHAQAQSAVHIGASGISPAHSVVNPGAVVPLAAKRVGQNARIPSAAAVVNVEILRLAGFGEVARRLIITGLVLLAAILLLIGLRRLKRHANVLLEQQRERIPAFRFRGLELVSARALFTNIARIATGLYLLCFALVVLGAALMVFGQFPATQGYARQVGLWLWNPFVHILRGALGYLPNLFYILVILVVARFILRMVGYVFGAAERGLISLEPWIHRDVARPTGLIVKVTVVVVTLFFIAPLIPGTGSTAAQGISIMLGVMISFGSTSTVGNFVAGIVLMFMRPFQLGERIRIGETTGDVIERTFLYTKVLSIKNEEIIIPSLTVLGAPITNYSARAHAQGLILHTAVTIGYDAPWRQVHELLMRAADRTAHVLKEPKPFVLQTALDDFYVRYQINVHTDQAARMAQIYSELHQNIQDSFNEARIEICSPHFHQLRDGNATSVPAEYHGQGYEAPRFRVETSPASTGA